MAASEKSADPELKVEHFNIFLEALQRNTVTSNLAEGAKSDLLKSATREFLPIRDLEQGEVALDSDCKIPQTLGALRKLVQRSKQLIRGGNETPWLDDHAEKLTYNRVFDGALSAVEKALGMQR